MRHLLPGCRLSRCWLLLAPVALLACDDPKPVDGGPSGPGTPSPTVPPGPVDPSPPSTTCVPVLQEEQHDSGADGVLEQWVVYAYDADGLLTTAEDYRADLPTAWDVTTYEHDGEGRLVRAVGDWGVDDEPADGVPDDVQSWTYDGGTSRVRREESTRGDGTTLYAWQEHEYDAGGRLVLSARQYGEDPVDADVWDRYTYDADGYVTFYEQEWAEPGYADAYRSSTYTYTEDRAEVRVRHHDGDETHLWYDSAGHLLRSDYSGGGRAVTARAIYTYDADGNLLTHDYDDPADWVIDDRATFTYDADGNLLTHEIGLDVIRTRITYVYGC